jgi:DNA polymerase-3 subunit beta
MEFKIDQGEISRKLALVQGIVECRNTMPILSHVFIKSDGGRSAIAASDLAITVAEPIEAAVTEDGGVCVPGRKLYEIVRELAGEISFSLAKNTLKVQSGGATYKLACLDTKEFPAWPAVDGKQKFTVSKKTLGDVIRKTSYAAGNNDTRYVLNGLLFHVKDTALNVVATDGHRLALVRETIRDSIEDIKVIVPARALRELKKFLSGEGDVEITLGKNHTLFSADGIQFVARNVEGAFPAYDGVIPSDNERTAVVDREDFYRGIKRVSLMNRQTHAIRMELGEKSLALSASHSDTGEASDMIGCEYSGEKMTVGFNSEFLMEALNAIDGDKVTLTLKSEVTPVVVYATGDGNHKNVIMPMRT